MTVADETVRHDRRAPLAWRWAGVAVLLVLLGAHLLVLNMDATATSRLIPVARLFDLAFLAFALILSHAAGRQVLALLGLTTSPTESVAFATALGLGIGAYLSLALGLVGLYRPPILIAGVAIATLALRREIVADVAGLVEFGDRVRHAQQRVVRRPLVAFVTMTAVMVASLLLILNLPGSYGPLPDVAEWLSDLLVEIEMPRFAGIIWYNVGLLNEWLYRLSTLR